MMTQTLFRTFVGFALIFSALLTPNLVVAQQPSPAQPVSSAASSDEAEVSEKQAQADYFMSTEHREKIYEAKRKQPTRAALLSLAFPGLGNIYAEQFLVAGLAFVAMAFAAVFVSYGIVTDQSRIVLTGGIVALGAYGGGVATSLVGVNNYNRQLRQGLKIEEHAELREAWTPMVTLRF